VDSANYSLVEGKVAQLVSLRAQAGAGVHVSGPAAKAHMEEEILS
jgi:hypothetical protein